MTEWPLERRLREDQAQRRAFRGWQTFEPDSDDESSRLVEQQFADEILSAHEAGSDPSETLAKLDERLRDPRISGAQPDPNDPTIARACIGALKKEPTASLWIFLWSMARESGLLGHTLPLAARAAAKQDTAFKEAFFDIAREIVKSAVGEPGRRAFVREKSQARHSAADWKSNPALSRIWSGQLERDALSLIYDDDGVFAIVADLDLTVFVDLLTLADNAYLVFAALQAAGGRIRFEVWHALIAAAPVAFDSDGSWNGSSVLPLLLLFGREQLQPQIRRNANDDEIKGPADETAALVAEITKALVQRGDAKGLAQRWTTTLMRHAMMGFSNEPVPYAADIRSQGYIDLALIDALAKALPGAQWSPESAPDAEPWEPWCYRAVLACVAFAATTPMPTVEGFLAEWRLAPEEWASERGTGLRQRASSFVMSGKRADAYGTRALALPLVETTDPVKAWEQLWTATGALREIVEFGDADSPRDEEWRGRSEAAQLMRLVFGLGLMMLDQIIMPVRPLDYDRRSAVKGLFSALTSVAKELAVIDRIDQGYWADATRHLAIRRGAWLSDRRPEPSPFAAVAFADATEPTFEDFVADLRGDVRELFALIEVALRNHVDQNMLKRAIERAGFDLSKEYTLAEELVALDPRRAGITAEQLSTVKTLFR